MGHRSKPLSKEKHFQALKKKKKKNIYIYIYIYIYMGGRGGQKLQPIRIKTNIYVYKYVNI